jgi:prolyl-tRNA editing enzyme YbaK/EbsC (Cys-tRNA(Pro) deacylase)
MPAECGKNYVMTDATPDRSILHERVREALEASGITEQEVLACAPELADTAEFCAHYGIAADEACNLILVALKTTPRQYIACLVRSDSRLDVNHRVSDLVGVKRMSFASAEETAALTDMMIGGVTIFGLPADMPIYVDTRVFERDRVIVGGGDRSSKIRLEPHELEKIPNVKVAEIAVPR